MDELKLNENDIVMKITVSKPVSKKDIVFNVIGNLLTRAGGDIAAKVNMILTKDTLYLEYKGHVSIGYAEETRDVIEIPLTEVKMFEVTKNENEELIKIETGTKEFLFIRDNTSDNNLALAMSKVVKKL